MVPGWRLGWIIVHDRNGAFKEVKRGMGRRKKRKRENERRQFCILFTVYTSQVALGLSRLAMKLLGPSTLIQAALPDILSNVPYDYHQKNIKLLHTNATRCCEILKGAPGLTPIMPKGAMYMMVGTLYLLQTIFCIIAVYSSSLPTTFCAHLLSLSTGGY